MILALIIKVRRNISISISIKSTEVIKILVRVVINISIRNIASKVMKKMKISTTKN